MSAYTVGLDFGTNSVRALIVRCADGAEVAGATARYESGERGVIADPRDHHLARQHPGDYLPALERSVRTALRAARRTRDFTSGRVAAIGVDATGSSPLPVDRHNRPLALRPKWRRHPAAQCWLWKDHTSWREAAEITASARRYRPDYLSTCGGTYSSEWFWSKLWHCARTAPEVFDAAQSWVELGDWIPAALAGVEEPARIVRSTGYAGLKAMYAEEWGGLPDARFLAKLDPRLARVRERLYATAHDAAVPAGALSGEWAERLGLPAGIPIANGGLDCHAGAIGCGVAEGVLAKIIGTSGCDSAVLKTPRRAAHIPGVCGMAVGAVLPGLTGVEAGQPAVGDIFRWWVEVICGGDAALHRKLTAEAAKLPAGASGLLALDWQNGNRTILADPRLTGVIVGCTLHTSRAEIYRALLEATAFGARTIIEHLRRHRVPIRRVVCAGGIAAKNSLLMQIYADVLGCPIEMAASANASALGSAIAAAVVAGKHRDFPAAQAAMVRPVGATFVPAAHPRKRYHALFRLYRVLHDGFGGRPRATPSARLMKELLAHKAQCAIGRAAAG